MIDFSAGGGPVVVVAPHPDDEVLGVGGTMARLAKAGREVHVVILTRGQPPKFDAAQIAGVKAEAERSHAILGVTETHWLGFPAAELDQTTHGEVNVALGALVKRIDPEVMFVPHPGDIHMDHQLGFLSSLVAARPYQDAYPGLVMTYEVVSETNWNAPYLTPSFVPNVFVDVTETLDDKIAAFEAFASQVKAFPHERSVDVLRALAALRGATVHRRAAEAFVLVRGVC